MTRLLISTLLVLPAVSFAVGQGQTQAAIGVVAVAEPPGPNQELADLASSLRSAVSQQTPGVLSTDEVRKRMSTRAPSASLSELDRAYSGAVAAHQSGDFEGAVRSLSAVIEDLERLPESSESFGQWTRAMLRLARAQGSLGRKADATETMKRLLRADSAVKADPELYPPSFQRQLDDVRKELEKEPKRKLVVKGPKDSRVFVEGREVGIAPVTLAVTAGKYRVSGVSPTNVRVAAGSFDVGAEDVTVNLDFSLVEMFRPTAGPGLAIPNADRAKLVVTAGGALKLDSVLTATVAMDGDVRFLVGTLYDVRRGMIAREGKLRLSGYSAPEGGLNALAAFLMTGQSSNLVISGASQQSVETVQAPAGALKVSSRPVKSGGSPILGWTAIGTGVVAVGLAGFATYEGLTANGHYNNALKLTTSDPDFRVLPGQADAYNGAIAQGNSAQMMGWYTGGGAAAAAIATGVLAYFAYQQTGAIGPFRF